MESLWKRESTFDPPFPPLRKSVTRFISPLSTQPEMSHTAAKCPKKLFIFLKKNVTAPILSGRVCFGTNDDDDE